MTSPRGPFNLDAYQPIVELASFYEAAEAGADAALENVCPAFVEQNRSLERYSDWTLLGRGGLKEVYRAFDQRTQRWVALARLREDRGLGYYDRFVHEAWLVSSLNHPNIIKVHDAGSDGKNRPFFTMDLKGNTSLEDLIAKAKPDSLHHLLEIFLKVCDAMAYAHSCQVIHLDLKPANIQCDRFGEVRVCDWGLGKSLESGRPEENLVQTGPDRAAQETLCGKIAGSLGYMAPEQVAGNRLLDRRTDLFALGCVLHAILCGRPPFTGTMDKVIEQTEKGVVPPLRKRFPARKIPKSLEAVVLKATARNPEDRYETVEQLREEIHHYLSGYSTQAEESGFLKEVALFVARNRRMCLLVLMSFFLVLGLSLFFVQRLGQARGATREERERVEQLLVEMNMLSEDFNAYSHEADVSRRELALQLSQAAENLRDLGLFHQPVEAVARGVRFTSLALELDPTLESARWNRFVFYAISLNFEAALDPRYLPQGKTHRSAIRLAKLFEPYNFTAKHRPRTEQLIAVYDRISHEQTELRGLLEDAFIFHVATTETGRIKRSLELEAVLAMLNGGREHLSMTYEGKGCVLTIRTDQQRLVLGTKTIWGGNRNLLTFLRIRSLKVVMPGKLVLKEFSGLRVEVMDLSAVGALEVGPSIDLPALQELVVRSGQVFEKPFRNRVRSGGEYRVTVVESTQK